VYSGSKIFAERAAWKFAEENPSLDLATSKLSSQLTKHKNISPDQLPQVVPSFVYGPFAPGFPPRGPGVSTNKWIQDLIVGETGRPVPPHFRMPFYVDVRDVARAHVEAIQIPKVPLGSDLESKRFLVSAGVFTWTDAILYLQETRPELQKRLPAVGEKPVTEGEVDTIDTRRAKEMLGFESFIGWKACVDDTINYFLELERNSSNSN
jgi:nucleoside-diphosphate-sugar epimerase